MSSCDKCGHTWQKRVDAPKQCPGCRCRLKNSTGPRKVWVVTVDSIVQKSYYEEARAIAHESMIIKQGGYTTIDVQESEVE